MFIFQVISVKTTYSLLMTQKNGIIPPDLRSVRHEVAMMQLPIEVKCPHCGAWGRILQPPPGAIVVGPCPRCREMVAIFSGMALPLRKRVMANGTANEKRNHVMAVLTAFLEDRVDKLLEERETHSPGELEEGIGQLVERVPESPDKLKRLPYVSRPKSRITQGEIDDFVNYDLHCLDDPSYFRSIFG